MPKEQIKSRKFRRFVYELSQNSRGKTKELGRKLQMSQQSASYLIASLSKKKKLLRRTVIIDPSKLGFISLLVYYNFADFTAKNINEILIFLQRKDNITHVEQLKQGYDLACTFCVPNLSQFNKMNRDFLQNFRHQVLSADIFPVVVEHLYPKKYLLQHRQFSDIVISGDRDVVQMSENEKQVLAAFYQDPGITVVEMARNLKLNSKTIVKIKKRLEQRQIIRWYSALWDYTKLEIGKRYLLLNSEDLSVREDHKLLEFAKVHPNIVRLTRLIGRYDILVGVEGENLNNKDVLKELRSEFGFKKYKVVESSFILKENYVPQLLN